MSNALVTNRAGDGTNDAIKTFKMLMATRNNEIPVKNSTKIDFDEQLPIEVKNSKKFKFDIKACCNCSLHTKIAEQNEFKMPLCEDF